MTPRIDYFLGEYQSTVNNALEKIRNHHLIERLWARDFTLWKEKPDEIANRLGWLDAPVKTLSRLNDFDAVIAPFGREDITDVVLLGMGGSSLAAEVFHKIFGSATGYPFLHIVDTTDPLFISRLAQKLPWEKLFLSFLPSRERRWKSSRCSNSFTIWLRKNAPGKQARDSFLSPTKEVR